MAYPERFLHDQNQPARRMKHRKRRLAYDGGAIAVESPRDCGGIAVTSNNKVGTYMRRVRWERIFER